MTHQPYRTRLCQVLVRTFCVLILLTPTSCGKKGSPKPPEAVAPSPVQFLTAKGHVDGITLFWEAPTTRVDGKSLNDLAGFVVKRSTYEKNKKPDFESVGEVSALYDEKAEELKAKSFRYTDRDVKPGKIYEYIVLPFKRGHIEGQRDQILRITFLGQSSVVENIH